MITVYSMCTAECNSENLFLETYFPEQVVLRIHSLGNCQKSSVWFPTIELSDCLKSSFRQEFLTSTSRPDLKKSGVLDSCV